MAEKQNGMFERGEMSGVEGSQSQERLEAGAERHEQAVEKPEDAKKDPGKVLERLSARPKGDIKEEGASGKANEELEKEEQAKKVIADALAAGEDIGRVQKIFADASKEINDPRLMDDIHDQYTEKRNL